jgi:ribokinase
MRDHTFHYKETLIPDIIYLTSIGKEWSTAYKNVLDFATENSVPIALSPGSHQMHDMNDIFIDVLKHSEMIFINKTEAELILKKLGKKTDTVPDLLRGLQESGPTIASVTDGERGSYCIDDKQTIYKISAFPRTTEMTEKTGAGDSYASGFLAEYLLSKSIPDAMRWGALNALSVMKHIGAQEGLLHTKDMTQALADHSDFKADIMN